MTGSILQVSVSQGGVPKHAIPTGTLTPAGFEGDSHAHPDLHGGSRQAVLLITAEGMCYRVDLRLRPDGSQGEVCISRICSAVRTGCRLPDSRS